MEGRSQARGGETIAWLSQECRLRALEWLKQRRCMSADVTVSEMGQIPDA